MASLIVVAGPNEGDYYPLGSRTLVIGRDEACPVQIADERVSRKHAQVRLDAGSYVVMDMKSANGTELNGRTLTTETRLAEGDTIGLGVSKIVFTKEDFEDRESAFAHWKQTGQRHRSTLMR
ncbi:MAG: FHA domain-containing protein [Phycisphaeraceae bacterium]|nr:FHA domain-containing protein [Phycisphaeraceae bacterium]